MCSVSRVKAYLLQRLWNRSLLREKQYPTRQNALKAMFFIVLAVPVATVKFLIFFMRRPPNPIEIHILRCEGEFGHLISLLEYSRQNFSNSHPGTHIVIQATRRHKAFGELYQSAITPRLVWSNSVQGLYAQALLLLPSKFVKAVYHSKRDSDNVQYPLKPLGISNKLLNLRQSLLRQLKMEDRPLVLLSVHTREYDLKRTPESWHKDWVLETVGGELVDAINHLSSLGVGLIRIGGRDSGKSRIPVMFPRLEEFGALGSDHEVALASACSYFWSDDDGGWWTTAPFKKPVLFTNIARFQLQRNYYPSWCLHVPALYQRLDGQILTFRQMMENIVSGFAPYKQAARGKLKLIRNSPVEICDAHSEMLARIDGTWTPTDLGLEYGEKMRRVWNDFPQFVEPVIPESFLERHKELLD